MESLSLVAVLEATLSPDQQTRITAELELAKLSKESITCLQLSQILLEQSASVHLRQMTGYVLKKYVKEYWSPFFPTFKGPTATSTEVKDQVRPLLFQGLSDPIRKIRHACAALISDLAHPDWPDHYPSLMTDLLALISSTDNPSAVEGGMRVLNEFVGTDLTEDQLLPVARGMLPQLLVVLGSVETHHPLTRARTILIFRQCCMTLFTVRDEHPEAVKLAVADIVPQWLEAFLVLLDRDLGRELGVPEGEGEGQGNSWEELAVRIAIFHTLETLLNAFPQTLKPYLSHFLTHSSTHLTLLLPLYTSVSLSSSSLSPPSPSEESSGDVPSDLSTLVSTLVDWETQVVGRARRTGQGLLTKAVETAVWFGRMTTDDEDNWASDPNAFVADEDDDMVTFNVRAACLDYVGALVEQFEDKTIKTLWTVFEKVAVESEKAKESGDADWWKAYESVLSLVGSVSPTLLEMAEENKLGPGVFDLGRIFGVVLPAFLGASETPFLQGRSFVFASQFAKILPPELAASYVDAAIKVLDDPSAGVPVKVSAVRALHNFFRHLKSQISSALAGQSLARLVPLVPQTSENTLTLVVDTCTATVKVADIDAQTAVVVVETVLNTWLPSPADPLLSSSICDLFTALSSVPTPAVQGVILTHALPTLSTVLAEIATDTFSSRASAALDLIDSVFDGQPTPLGAGLFDKVAETLFEAMRVSEDRDVVQSGLRVVTTTVRKDVQQLLNCAQGPTGLELVLAQVAKLLQPDESEAGGLFVGDLVLHLIRTAGTAIGPVLPDLLRAFVTRLATAKTASFAQSLILPFAYLAHSQSDTVLTLLEGIDVPGSGSALQILLNKWCDNVEVLQGYWNQKVSTVGLMQLYLSQRPSLQQIQVKGDLLLTEVNSNKIMTRAQAKKNPDQFPPIPFPAKALKILLHDVQRAGDDATLSKADGGIDELEDAESDDGDDDWADEGAEFKTGDDDLDFLSDMLGRDGALAKYMNDDGSEDGALGDSDEDLKDDPIYTLDIQSQLITFFKQAYETNTNSFRQVAEQFLNGPEKEVLSQILQRA
ncbi:ARM repeat-containing protein [Meredithblackwellia eburnea MCA 4105]